MTKTDTNGISSEAREEYNRYAREYRKKRLEDPVGGEAFRERQRQYNRDYYAANREALREKARRFYWANRKRLLEKARQRKAQMRRDKAEKDGQTD